MQYQHDYILRLIEQMGAVLREAFAAYRGGAASEEPLALTEAAIGLVVDMDPQLFLQLAPQSMVSLIEISNTDERLVAKLSEVLVLEADILDSEGRIIEANVRREQAAALRDALDPAHAN